MAKDKKQVSQVESDTVPNSLEAVRTAETVEKVVPPSVNTEVTVSVDGVQSDGNTGTSVNSEETVSETSATQKIESPWEKSFLDQNNKISELNRQIFDLSFQLESAQKELINVRFEYNDLKKHLEEIQLLNETKSEKTGDQVILDGNSYAIIHRNTVRELAEDYKKRFVDENHTAVVIEKIGG